MQKDMSNILIADDNAALAATLADFIRGRGMGCICARTGKQALAQFKLHRPVLVLLDIKMPCIDGVEVARQIHEEAPEIPIVLMSGFPIAVEEANQADLGVAAVVDKPIPLKALGRIIDELRVYDPPVIPRQNH